MNGRKILLAKLSQGLIGEENSYLLGTLLVSKLNQMAMSRQELQASERAPFYLYVDEFHNFVTPSMAGILSGARKYRLGLILAHQELHQLSSRDSDVASAVISNPYTRICFRLGDFDAKKLEDGFSFFKAKDLQNLGVGEAVCRMERSDYDFNLTTTPLPIVDRELAAQRRKQVVESSRRHYALKAKRTDNIQTPSYQAPSAPEDPRPRERDIRPPTPPPAGTPIEHTIRKTPPVARKTPTPGRGGQQHKYLQQLIKRWAEDRGYRATIEKQILSGLGSVDIALEKDNFSIACEVSVSTSAEHELGNIQKCLAAGFNVVAVLATEQRTLRRIAAAAKSLSPEDLERVLFFMPEELFSFIEEREAKATATEQTVKGYRVKVKLGSVSQAQQQAKKRVIMQAILQSMNRLKNDSRS